MSECEPLAERGIEEVRFSAAPADFNRLRYTTVRVSPNRDHLHFYGALVVRGGREIAMTTTEETSAITVNF